MDDPVSNDSVISEDLACCRCGYNLRGLDRSGKCPECGSQIEQSIIEARALALMGVAVRRQRLAAKIIAITIAAAYLSVLLNNKLTRRMLPGFRDREWVQLIVVGLLWLAGLWVAWLLTSRDRIHRAAPRGAILLRVFALVAATCTAVLIVRQPNLNLIWARSYYGDSSHNALTSCAWFASLLVTFLGFWTFSESAWRIGYRWLGRAIITAAYLTVLCGAAGVNLREPPPRPYYIPVPLVGGLPGFNLVYWFEGYSDKVQQWQIAGSATLWLINGALMMLVVRCFKPSMTTIEAFAAQSAAAVGTGRA